MRFNPETYAIPDEAMKPFIDPDEINAYLQNSKATKARVREIIAKSLAKKRLNLEETAILINADDPELIEEIKNGARELKKTVYGNRIVLFAPLYIGNHCINNCKYCGFSRDNAIFRTTLTVPQVVQEAKHLHALGFKQGGFSQQQG